MGGHYSFKATRLSKEEKDLYVGVEKIITEIQQWKTTAKMWHNKYDSKCAEISELKKYIKLKDKIEGLK